MRNTQTLPKIQLEHIGKVFQTNTQKIVALDDVNMEIYPGELVSVVGPSGCGKSTIIRIIDNLIEATSGVLKIDGQQVGGKKTTKELLQRIGFIFQQPNLLPWLTVRENVMLPLKVFGLKGQKWEDNADQLIKMVGLTDYAGAYPAELSGGMLQRIGVIRAMVHDPEILLMDEPFGALDDLTREQLNMELLSIWERTKKTIIFITHNVEEAVLISSKVYVMATNPGRIVGQVPIDLPYPRRLAMVASEPFVDYYLSLCAQMGEFDLSKLK